MSDVQIINKDLRRGPFHAAIFDFDGTLSLLRRGWQQVMIPMAVEHMAATGTAEQEDQLFTIAEDFVTHLTGRQTIYQMIQLATEVKKRGGVPTDRNFDFLQSTQEEPLVQLVRVCRGGHGRLCTHAPRPFLGMLSEIGGSWGDGGAENARR